MLPIPDLHPSNYHDVRHFTAYPYLHSNDSKKKFMIYLYNTTQFKLEWEEIALELQIPFLVLSIRLESHESMIHGPISLANS